MALIQLTKGFQTLIDDEDFEELNQHRWYAAGKDHRPARRIGRYITFMYHQILNWAPTPGMVVDHINRNPLDNRRENLRIVSHQRNMLNGIRSLAKTGVSVDRTHGTYKAYLDLPYRSRINLGTKKTREEAEALVQIAKQERGL